MAQFEYFGIKGLDEKPRSRHPCTLTYDEKELVIKLARENPRSIPKIIALKFKKTGKPVSDTIKRILKAAKGTKKRVIKSLKGKRDTKEFKTALEEIKELRRQHDDGEIEVWYFDETGFDLQPMVPLA